eukprot:755355-Hanusia_phi.AAC.7
MRPAPAAQTVVVLCDSGSARDRNPVCVAPGPPRRGPPLYPVPGTAAAAGPGGVDSKFSHCHLY